MLVTYKEGTNLRKERIDLKVVVIGGVAAGMSAAAKIKRVSADTRVTVYEKSGYLAYGACGLAFYVGGANDGPAKLIARSRAAFEQAGIKTFIHHEVTQVDTVNKVVVGKALKTGDTFRDTYDKLMIATGARAVIPPVEGSGKQGIYTLKTMEDGLKLKKAADSFGVRNVIVVGGGYIGVEVAEAMRRLGKNVVLLEEADSILAAFEPEIAAIAAREIEKNGVEVRAGERLRAFHGRDAVSEVATDSGTYEADLVVAAVGVVPNTAFLQGTGIKLAANGAVVIDRQMRASVPDIYAAGDCAQVYSSIRKENVYLPLGTTANKCGRIAGSNICGAQAEYVGTIGSAALKVFGLEAGRTGLSSAEAESLGYRFGTVLVESVNHPAYYPGMEPVTVKLVYEKPGFRVLGAQLIGGAGSALRTDIFAMAVQRGMTTKELGMTDLIYSPPYATVWDAVHIAANAAR